MPSQDLVTNKAPIARRGAPDFTNQLIQPFNNLRNELDRLFGGFPFEPPTLGTSRIALAVPAVEVKETDKQYKVTAELAGMEPEDVEVTFDDGVLRIAGEKKQEREENEQGYQFAERSYGSFERLIELPAAAKAKRIKAKFKNGLLTVTVPKNDKPQSKAQHISIDKEG